MKDKRPGAFISVGSLLMIFLAGGFVGCSLETSSFSRSKLSKQTYVRANLRASKSTAAATPVRYRAASFNPARPARIIPATRSTTPIVRLPHRKDFRRYAVAYGNPYAVVQDKSIIPFALSSGSKPLKRFEFPFFKKKKKKNTTEPKKAEDTTPVLEQLVAEKPIIRSVRTTAYTHNERDHLKYGRRNALGTRLRFGSVRSAAADWSRYPVGTQFRITNQPGILYEVDDYGGALVGTGTIDLYKPTFSAMNRWGVRHVDIEVVKWGSFDKSLKVLKPRTKWSHIRRMIKSIHNRGASEKARLTALILSHRPPKDRDPL